MRIEVLFTPAELVTLTDGCWKDTACVVLDVLRATSTMVAALAHGARAVRPVGTIEEALRVRGQFPDCLLAGEREGLRITSKLTGGTEFDLGNSPREYTPDRVAGRTIVMTTTNGTRALQACRPASLVLAGAFLNLSAVADAVRAAGLERLVVVCGGTGQAAAYEDALAAGALCSALDPAAELMDSARIAEAVWRACGPRFSTELDLASNARRLRTLAELAPDVSYCSQRDKFTVVPTLMDGTEMRIKPGEI